MAPFDSGRTEPDAARPTPRGLESPKSPAPPKVQHGAEIRLQSRHGVKLFFGREPSYDAKGRTTKPRIPGVAVFAGAMQRMRKASLLGDPYADWAMVQLDAAHDKAVEDIKAFADRLDELLSGKDQSYYQTLLTESNKPLVRTLNFKSPYAFRAADIVSRCDRQFLRMEAAMHTAAIARPTLEAMSMQLFRVGRSMFHTTLWWKPTGVTRAHFLPSLTARGEQAIKTIRRVPNEDVLHGRVVPKYGYFALHKAGLDLKAEERTIDVIDDEAMHEFENEARAEQAKAAAFLAKLNGDDPQKVPPRKQKTTA